MLKPKSLIHRLIFDQVTAKFFHSLHVAVLELFVRIELNHASTTAKGIVSIIKRNRIVASFSLTNCINQVEELVAMSHA